MCPRSASRIDPSAVVHDGAELGADVFVGHGAIVYPNVSLGAGSSIEPYAIVGNPPVEAHRASDFRFPRTVLGEASVVRSHSVVYAGSSFGRGFQTGHRVLIREGTVIGDHCSVGTGAELYGDLEVGDHTRIQSYVGIGKGTKVGSFVWIYVQSLLVNDRYPPAGGIDGPIVEDYAVIGASVIVHAGVRIGAKSLVGSGSVVSKDVPSERLVMGNPAREIGPVADIRGPDGERPYPWMERVGDYGYPWQRSESGKD